MRALTYMGQNFWERGLIRDFFPARNPTELKEPCPISDRARSKFENSALVPKESGGLGSGSVGRIPKTVNARNPEKT